MSPTDYRLGRGYRESLAKQDAGPLRQASPADAGQKADTTGTMFSRAYDGFAAGASWLGQLALMNDSVLQREGTRDLKLFNALLDDDVAATAFGQRQLALVKAPWVVEPGDPDDPRSVLAADDLRDMMKVVGWDRVTKLMFYGRWFGYAVGEFLFEMRVHNGRTIVWLRDVVVPDRNWFRFTNAGELRMITPSDADGVPVPANRFWTYRTGATHDFEHYGLGLAHWCYWPIWFKRNVMQFWALYLEKFGQPTAVGYFEPGADQDEIDKVLAAAKAIGQDSAVAFPAPPSSVEGAGGPDLRPHLIEAQRSGSGAESYDTFTSKMDDALRGIIIGQPGTSRSASDGLNGSQAEVHEGVAATLVTADSDEFHESYSRTAPAWLTLWNHGPDVAAPIVSRNFEQKEGADTIAERDTKLKALGWDRTEDSFRETYGDGYEKAPPPPPPVMPGVRPGRAGLPGAANDNPADKRVAVFAAGDPRPLYISRKLLNGAALLKWAKEQGFTNLVDADELHATICYSRTAVDWFAMPSDWSSNDDGSATVEPGGPRKAERFGDDAVVLMFKYSRFAWRNEELVEAGASQDYDPYRPHVTFAKGEQSVDLDKVAPFTDALEFGPEIWETLDTDPLHGALAPTFSAAELDRIDALAAGLVADTDPLFQAMGSAMASRVAEFESGGMPMTPEAFRVAMLQTFETLPLDKVAKLLTVPMATAHAAAAAGVEGSVTA
jgi:hypothetical protein